MEDCSGEVDQATKEDRASEDNGSEESESFVFDSKLLQSASFPFRESCRHSPLDIFHHRPHGSLNVESSREYRSNQKEHKVYVGAIGRLWFEDQIQ